MQFVTNGPDVPEKLLQAHEEGKVVFFCGAGISFPAGLPSFGGLVCKLYDQMGVTPDAVQKQALNAEQFDTAVSLLEAVTNTNEWRRDIRVKMAKLLHPDYSTANATSTHKALLQLSKTKDKKTRLITTNFDRVFHKAREEGKFSYETYQAPLLPVPKNRWDGLVYLHGLLPEKPNGADLDHLVVSSGDFGLAYLTERWAARFVSELFRSYTVCFVGYSINDPVLRYMMDALAADRMLGENPPEMFVFGVFKKGELDSENAQWKAKNVTPILYKRHSNHYYFHETMKQWAITYRDGLGGKEQIVATAAFYNPSTSDLHNDYAKKLAWALSDPTGIPAKKFSQLEPSPSISWLSVLDSIELKRNDLSRFGVDNIDFDRDLKFSLLSRPAKSVDAPFMRLSSHSHNEVKWDKIMRHLGRWLTHHLNDRDLVLYILKHGGTLHSELRRLINWEINEQRKNKLEANTAYFDRLKKKSDDAEICDYMLTVWEIVLAGYCVQPDLSINIYSWLDEYKHSSLTTSLKNELRAMLSPKVYFRKPYSSETDNGIKNLLDWDVSLAVYSIHSELVELEQVASWKNDISALFSTFNDLLLEVMELKQTLHEVSKFSDYTYIQQPSIQKHAQNKHYNSWTVLIELLRDSWLSLLSLDQELANNVILIWWKTPFPIFKRLALFALTQSETIPVQKINSWLEQDDCRWLWSVNVQRELMQLLPILAPKLIDPEKRRLLTNIFNGPKREWFKREIDDAEFKKIKDRDIWLRIEKLKNAGLQLDIQFEELYQVIAKENPAWCLNDEQKEEFPFWMSSGSEHKSASSSPLGEKELIEWLKDNPKHDHWETDDWPLRCKNDFDTVKNVLIQLEADGVWIAERWREAFQVWTDNRLLSFKAWRYLSDFILSLGEDKLVDISWNLAQWLKGNHTCKIINIELFFGYFDKLLGLPYVVENDDFNDPLNAAINHPIGIITESFFKQWYSTKPKNNEGLADEYQQRLEEIVQNEKQVYSLGKAIVATNALSLFMVDPKWTKKFVLPWFNWQDSNKSLMAWRSYLWSPRLHKYFLVSIKEDLLETANHYDDLGHRKEQYARFLTSLALQQYTEYKVKELVLAFKSLPENALHYVASSLSDSLSSSGEKLTEYWEHRVRVFLMRIWPKQTNLSDQTVNQLALLCINARDNFVDALSILKHNLVNIEDTEYLVHKLRESNLLESYPKQALEFLDSLIAIKPKSRPPSKLKDCLLRIAQIKPELKSAQGYERLEVLVRQV